MKSAEFLIAIAATVTCSLSIVGQTASPPELLAPASGVFMDNGCGDRSDSMDWDFEWTPVPGAKKYHLIVQKSGTRFAAIDKKSIKESRFEHRSKGAFAGPAAYLGWAWKVRALVGKEWTDWSRERQFVLEPVNTDCKK